MTFLTGFPVFSQPNTQKVPEYSYRVRSPCPYEVASSERRCANQTWYGASGNLLCFLMVHAFVVSTLEFESFSTITVLNSLLRGYQLPTLLGPKYTYNLQAKNSASQ